VTLEENLCSAEPRVSSCCADGALAATTRGHVAGTAVADDAFREVGADEHDGATCDVSVSRAGTSSRDE